MEDNIKIYPPATSDIAKVFGFGDSNGQQTLVESDLTEINQDSQNNAKITPVDEILPTLGGSKSKEMFNQEAVALSASSGQTHEFVQVVGNLYMKKPIKTENLALSQKSVVAGKVPTDGFDNVLQDESSHPTDTFLAKVGAKTALAENASQGSLDKVMDSNANDSTPRPSVNAEPLPSSENKLVKIGVLSAIGLFLARFFKKLLPYVAVFTVGLGLYWFFFSKSNFSLDLNKYFKTNSNTSQTQSAQDSAKITQNKNTASQQIISQNLDAYKKWIASYYYEVSDAKILDPNTDNSGNGLTNFQKYMFNLNPKTYDTLGLGKADSETLASGINPLTGGAITDGQKNILNNYVDMESVMNRLALSNAQNPQNKTENTPEGIRGYVAGNRITGNGLNPVVGQGAQNQTQGVYSSFEQNFPNQSATEPGQVRVSPATGPKALGGEISNSPTFDSNGINGQVPGILEIPSLNITVPVVWTADPKNFEKDLQNGAVHYPGTAMPGQIGTIYVSGHSSNYSWAKGKYNKVFSVLGNLKKDASVRVTVTNLNGSKTVFHYVVTDSKEYKSTDQNQFKNGSKPVLALSTCWPVGTTNRRLVVFAEQTQITQ